MSRKRKLVLSGRNDRGIGYFLFIITDTTRPKVLMRYINRGVGVVRDWGGGGKNVFILTDESRTILFIDH